jgi:hypothetical protein
MNREGVSIREAGKILRTLFLKAQDVHKKLSAIAAPVESEAAEEAAPSTSDAKEEADTPAKDTAADTAEGEIPSRNEPLSFGLKNIEPNHPSVQALGIREDTLTSFGAGYYHGRGMMGHHIVIPIYNPGRELIAYAGFHPEERTYTYPPKFRRG